MKTIIVLAALFGLFWGFGCGVAGPWGWVFALALAFAGAGTYFWRPPKEVVEPRGAKIPFGVFAISVVIGTGIGAIIFSLK